MAKRGVFARIYEENFWGGSGWGSRPEATTEYRALLQNFLRANAIATVVDVGCGDWEFSRLIDWSGVQYTGYDVVPSLIERNRSRYGRANVRFFDMPERYGDIARADLILCKDVLQHLSLAHAEELLSVMEQRAKFVLVTNCVTPESHLNLEIDDGDWRPLDVALDPFVRRPVNLAMFGTKKVQLVLPGWS